MSDVHPMHKLSNDFFVSKIKEFVANYKPLFITIYWHLTNLVFRAKILLKYASLLMQTSSRC